MARSSMRARSSASAVVTCSGGVASTCRITCPSATAIQTDHLALRPNAPNLPYMIALLLRALLVGILIAAIETVHGILRVRWLNRHFGDKRARRVTVVSGSLLVLFTAWVTVPWLGIRTQAEAWITGAVWVVLLLVYDLGLGRWYFGFSWQRLLADFDPRRGGMLGVGMLVLLAAPWLACVARGLL